MVARRILIVDDNVSLRVLLRTYLGDAGYDTVEAGDGETAISLALSERIDLVLLDVMLPKRSGIEVLREIRARRDMPVVLMSSLSEPELVDLASDADAYVRKPFRPGDVAKCVTAVLAEGAA